MGHDVEVSMVDDAADNNAHNNSTTQHGFSSDVADLPASYFYSPRFLGTVLATGLGCLAAVGGYGLAAPNLTLINEDIGPSNNIAWVSLVYTLTGAIGLLLVGRLSDLFGRRYFFIGSAAVALVGCIVSAVAQNVPTLIGGTALVGLASCGQLSFPYITGELVPMRYRFAMNSLMYVFCVPFSGFAPIVSKSFILHTAAGWRCCYYTMIGVNFASGLLFVLFYFPPTFHEKYRDRSIGQQLRDLDYVGIVLFTAGLFVFLLGLSWGGQEYAWKSAQVISTMVVGGVVLIAFVFWEIYCVSFIKEPLLPIHLFSSVGWSVSVVLLGLGASIYYAFAIIWPEMVAVLYTDDGGASMYAGWLSCAPSAMINAGQIVSGLVAAKLGRTKIQVITALVIGGALLGSGAAAGPDDKSMATAIIIVASFFIGWNESVTLGLSGIELLDQREIGTAIGAASSMRSTISCIASAVYLSVLSNRLAARIPAVVTPAVESAGLPASSVPAYLSGFSTGSFTGIPGLTDQIQAVGETAYRLANSQAYSTVFLTTLAFTGLAILLSFLAPNVDDKMTGQIAATLHVDGANPSDKSDLEEKAVQEV
ncbi:hypothetical protein SEUCBS139899_010253 [Sporothrix eucalyptigena]|uniref:Major facilitator superfamily (MFS) profile domain-containing protein n=1 Tax=Sporothrix eucalyptigena TaxID=1812306 RepID=A0ABP0BKC1_9PEZI